MQENLTRPREYIDWAVDQASRMTTSGASYQKIDIKCRLLNANRVLAREPTPEISTRSLLARRSRAE